MANKIALEFVEVFDKYIGSEHFHKLDIPREGAFNREVIRREACSIYRSLGARKRISAKLESYLKELTRLLTKLMQGHLYDTPDGKAPEWLK